MNEAKAGMGQGETDWRRSLLDIFSRRGVRGAGYGLIVIFFIFLVLLPTLFVLSYLFTGWNDIQSVVLADRARMDIIWNAIGLSFGVAFFVTFLDMIFGLPLAWFIVRRKFKGKSLLNTIIDSPLAVPTAGLGISVVLSRVQTAIALLHQANALALFVVVIYMLNRLRAADRESVR